MPARCAAITRGGSQCSSPVLPDSRYCWTHDPAAAERRREASRKGGKARSNKARAAATLPAPMTPQDVHTWLGVIFLRVIEGETEPSVGTAAATIARAMLETAKVASFEDELAQLRHDLAALADERSA